MSVARATLVPMATVEDLAENVWLDPADLRVILAWLDVEGDDVTSDLITAVDGYVNAQGQRSVPEMYWRGLSPDWRD